MPALFDLERIVFDPVEVNALLIGPNGPVAKHILKLAVQVAGQAQELCPVDTGRLRGSIRFTVQSNNGEIVGYVGSNVRYAIYVEMGTRYMSAQPYLRPALDMVLGLVS